MSKSPAIIKPERVVESVSRTGIEGYFEVELIHKPTGLVKQKLRFKNLITNAALEAIGDGTFFGFSGFSAQSIFGRNGFGTNAFIGVGSGTTEPAITDTALASQVGSRTASEGSPAIATTAGAEASYDYFWRKVTKVFFPGESTGNLTEVGVFRESAGGVMLCRQLFRDSLGVPTTIVKTADDELRITYEFRCYTMKSSNVTTTTIKSVSTTCTTRGYDIDAAYRYGPSDLNNNGDEFNGIINSLGVWGTNTSTNMQGLYSSSTMPAETATQTGAITGCSSVAWGTYSANTRYREQTIIWNPGLGSLPVGSVIWGGTYSQNTSLSSTNIYAPFITTFSPSFTKTDTERFTFVGRMSWGRV